MANAPYYVIAYFIVDKILSPCKSASQVTYERFVSSEPISDYPRAKGSATRTANMNKRRAKILLSASDIIASQGIESLTLGKLAAKADVTIPTIHNLIGKKEQIYELLVTQMVGRIQTALTSQPVADPISAAETFIDNLIDLFHEDEALYKAAFVAGEKIGFFNQHTPDGIFDRSLELVRQVCIKARENGDLSGNIETERMARQIFACQRMARHDWVSGYIDLDTYRVQVLTGMFITYAADASPALRVRLMDKIESLGQHSNKLSSPAP